jgi:hypothetical protein
MAQQPAKNNIQEEGNFMTDSTEGHAAHAQQAVTVHGGTFSGVTAIGQQNAVQTGPVSMGQTDLDELRQLVDDLVEQLAAGNPTDADRVVAKERAEALAEELADDEPNPKRVGRLWGKLLPLLETIKIGFDIAKMSGLVSNLVG